MSKNIPPRHDQSPCIVLCNGQYSEVMGYAKANDLAMRYAANKMPASVYRLIEEVYYGGR